MAIKNCIRKILVSFLGSGMAVRSGPPSRSLPLTLRFKRTWSGRSARLRCSAVRGGLLGSVVGRNGWLVGFVFSRSWSRWTWFAIGGAPTDVRRSL